MGDSMREVVETLDSASRQLVPSNIDLGTLIPLKTTLELRDNLTLGLAYITRAPTKLTNDVVTIVRSMVSEDSAKGLPHLRRCSKPSDLPPHLKAQYMNEGPSGRTIHTGKSQYLYIMLGLKKHMSYEDLVEGLSSIDGIRDDIFLALIPVPLLAPTSQVQANMWSQQFWQTVYRKNNPLGPHPSNICRTTSVISRDASVWMTLAHQIAKKTHKAGYGEPIGAVIIKRTVPARPDANKPDVSRADRAETTGEEVAPGDSSDSGTATGSSSDTRFNEDTARPNEVPNEPSGQSDEPSNEQSTEKPKGQSTQQPNDKSTEQSNEQPNDAPVELKEKTEIVALAGDARWYRQERTGRTGNPMAHAALRAISMVAQKLVRAEKREPGLSKPILEFEAFQDKPLLGDERIVFDAEHPSPDGYLCHELELYMTHEPCTMCAMAILHSRMGRIVFRHRMPLTGGMSPEDRGYEHCSTDSGCPLGSCGGGQGLGLHWRKELNWSMLGWEWETDRAEHLEVDPHLHA